MSPISLSDMLELAADPTTEEKEARRRELDKRIEERRKVDPSTLPITADLHDWVIGPEWDGNYVIYGTIGKDTKGRFYPGQFIRTSLVVATVDDIAITLNSAYRLVGPENGTSNDD